jgi:acetoacetate decarboxylase
MKREQILNLPSISAASPSYPQGPYHHFIKSILGGHHFIADLTLPYGRVLCDYQREGE